MLFIAAGAVFVTAVFWQVLPRGGLQAETTDRLKTRLAQERKIREQELRAELEALQAENRKLRSELEEGRNRPVE